MKIEFEIDLSTEKDNEFENNNTDSMKLPSKVKIISSEHSNYIKCLEEICTALFGLGYGWATQTNHLVERIIQNSDNYLFNLTHMLIQSSIDPEVIGWSIYQSKPLSRIRSKLFDSLKDEGLNVQEIQAGFKRLKKHL